MRYDAASYLGIRKTLTFTLETFGVGVGRQTQPRRASPLPARPRLLGLGAVIESSRSQMELLEAFESYRYPNEIGPGVYDIHSPRVPTSEEMLERLMLAAKHLSCEQIWVNPDCGLKTRRWEEVEPALRNMVGAAKAARAELAGVR